MERLDLSDLRASILEIKTVQPIGRIVGAATNGVRVRGLSERAALGDCVKIGDLYGEIVDLGPQEVVVLADGGGEGLRVGAPVALLGNFSVSPDDSWLGRIIGSKGEALDGAPLRQGAISRPLQAAPPPAITRRPLGARLATGQAVLDTLLPIVRGQRIGLFAGSGVGKSMLLGRLARDLEADVVVLALVGERGREVREFVTSVLGDRMDRSVVVAATSDQSALARRQALWTAMTVAEHFRDGGNHVLFLADSVTRFAEAHREVAIAAGEGAGLRGFPPSTTHLIMSLAERAGPGPDEAAGDITGVFSVLVAGSDMDEPIANILRGVLDGHIVLSREIAERGRFPAVDVLESVSRSLPEAASPEENALIGLARKRLGVYERSELMVQSGLYKTGSDPELDAAVKVWPALDTFFSESSENPEQAFERLALCLGAPRNLPQ
ncbi:MAG: FliI/YscN family ATPase [Pseudomonadota bacterium]